MFRPARLASTTAGAAVACLLVVNILAVPAAPAAAAAPAPPTYAPPVDAPISDPFRAPADRYAAGNRGIEYATTPGAAVVAAADGVVRFAGVVARQLWVTLAHADGLRTTVGPLAEATVAAGDRVVQGDMVGRAAGALLFTVRRGDDYIDPASVLTGAPMVRLVADGAPVHQRTPAAARAGLGTDVVVGLIDRWRGRDEPCTPNDVELARPIAPRVGARLAVLVGGLGSASDRAAIDRIDLAGLGYEPGAAVRFSYAGGRTPAPAGRVAPALATIPATPYAPADTLGALEVAATGLADLLVAVVEATPTGAPVDVLAHSQGGLVTRLALARLEQARPDVINRLGVVVTFGSPHHGAPIAAVISALAANHLDTLALEAVRQLAGTGIEPGSVAVRELAPGSATIRRLDALPVPVGVRFVSIAARSDVVVPPSRAWLAGATNVVVAAPGLDDHGALPGAPAAARQVALALAGLPPACTSVPGGLLTGLVGAVIDAAEGLLTG
jgi:hypothetical protein